MKIKRLPFSLLIIALIFVVAACGGEGSEDVQGSVDNEQNEGQESNSVDNEQNEEQDSDSNSDSDASASNGGDLVLSFATADMGGAYYPVGAYISQLINDHIDGVQANVEVTGGALENPLLIHRGQAHIGITNANLAYFALHGEEFFDEEMPTLTQLFTGMSPGVFQVVTLADSDINSIEDLKGKSVAVGPQGGTGLSVFPQVFEAHGFTMDDITPSFLSYQEGTEAVAGGTVDASIVMSAMPATAIQDIANNRNIKMIGISDDKIAELMEEHSYFVEFEIPAEEYGAPETVNTVGIPNMQIISSEVPEDVVYEITKVIFENLDTVHNAHPTASYIQLEGAAQEVIPLHPGAKRYFEEVGELD